MSIKHRKPEVAKVGCTTAAICGAKLRDGRTCRQFALPNGRCKYHGGKSLKGIESPKYRHGMYSKYMPRGLFDKFQESLTDERLYETRRDIALVDARIKELLEKLTSGESGQVWQRLTSHVDDLKEANDAGDQDAAGEAVRAIVTLIRKGGKDFHVWRDLNEQIDRRSRLVSQEFNRLIQMEQVFTAEQSITFASRLLQVVMDNVQDEAARFRIASKFREYSLETHGRGDGAKSVSVQGELLPLRAGDSGDPLEGETVGNAQRDGGGPAGVSDEAGD